jgi:hypothetical protein
MNRLSTLLVSLLALPACVDQPDLETAETDQAVFSPATQTLFDKFKQLEGQYPMPPAHSTINVGTINSLNRTFSGLQTTTEIRYDELGKPRTIVKTPNITIDGVNATLSFSCANRPKLNRTALTAVINGVTYTSSTSTLAVDVRLTKVPQWTFSCDGVSFSDKLTIWRPYANAVGAFEVTAMPLGLLYEPPMNAANTNWASYSSAVQRSSTVSIATSTMTSTTGAPTFDPITTVGQKLDALKNLEPALSPIAGLLGDLKNVVGSTSQTITNATTVSSDRTVEYTLAGTEQVRTDAKSGPGRGDLVHYLRRARFVWTMVQGTVALTLIDSEAVYGATIDEIRADLVRLATQPAGALGPITALDRISLEGLLALDPFATNNWPASRFEYITERHLAAGEIYSSNLCHTYKETDKQTQSSTKTTVTKTEEGWLGVLGIGPEDGSSTTQLTESSSRSTSIGSTVCASFELRRSASEPPYGVTVYYDRQFGTFVFKKV